MARTSMAGAAQRDSLAASEVAVCRASSGCEPAAGKGAAAELGGVGGGGAGREATVAAPDTERLVVEAVAAVDGRVLTVCAAAAVAAASAAAAAAAAIFAPAPACSASAAGSAPAAAVVPRTCSHRDAAVADPPAQRPRLLLLLL